MTTAGIAAPLTVIVATIAIGLLGKHAEPVLVAGENCVLLTNPTDSEGMNDEYATELP